MSGEHITDPSISRANQASDNARDLAIFHEYKNVFVSFTRGHFEVRPPKPEHKTFCVDLEPLSRGEAAIIYGSPRFYEQTGESEAKAVNSFFHEINHVEEVIELLDEENGETIWKKDMKHRAKNRRLQMLDNLVDDVRMDRGIALKAPNQEELSQKMYHEDLYPSGDFTSRPRHVQFAYAVFYENRVGEAIVSPEVRAEIDALKAITTKSGRTMWDVQGDTAIAPSIRIGLRKKYMEPAMERLYQLDLEEKKKEQEEKSGDGQNSSGEQSFTSEYDEFDTKNPDKVLDMKQLAEEIGKYAKDIPTGKLAKETGVPLKDQADLKKFKQAMQAFAQAKNKQVQSLLQPGETRDEFRDGLNKALDAGVDPAAYFAYHAQKEALEQVTNPQTGELVIAELRKVFERIITERLQKKRRPRHPLKEGVFLKDPATAYIESKYLGVAEPEVWSDYRNKYEARKQCGAIDIVLIADRSGSMKGEKASEQRKAILLLLEAVQEFIVDMQTERTYGNVDEDDDLGVRIGVRSFGGANQNEEIKPLSDELTEKDRIHTFKKLGDTSGDDTQDFVVMQAVADGLSYEDTQTLKKNKRRMLVIVLTDGHSSNKKELQKQIKKLRDVGVMVVGVGVTDSGEAAKDAYAPNGIVCSELLQLAGQLSEILIEFLDEV